MRHAFAGETCRAERGKTLIVRRPAVWLKHEALRRSSADRRSLRGCEGLDGVRTGGRIATFLIRPRRSQPGLPMPTEKGLYQLRFGRSRRQSARVLRPSETDWRRQSNH
jgi:hypothetical protein